MPSQSISPATAVSAAGDPMKFKGLLPRIATALVVLVVLLVLVWVPALSPVFTLFIGALCGLGLHEFYLLVRAKGGAPVPAYLCIAAGVLVVLIAHLNELAAVNAALIGACIVATTFQVVRGPYSVAGIAAIFLGLVYVAWTGAHFVLLEHTAGMGPGAVMVLLVAVVLTDTGAYFVGSMIGRHKMAPKVSPGKTWEGAAGGLILALIGMALVHFIVEQFAWPGFPSWSLGMYLAAGALLSLASQAGDLSESAMKRDAGVKDSGTLLPGHGGVLDRCDGFLFAGPVLYYILLFS
jgi:phosphatidate cytidylyltransferase